jgi:hypothetical protein
MKPTPLTRRGFVKTSLMASAAIPLSLRSQTPAGAEKTAGSGAVPALAKSTLPMGKIGGQEFSRLMLGGNLISGYSHARDLAYVAHALL